MSAIAAVYFRNKSSNYKLQLESNLRQLNRSMSNHGLDGSLIWLGQQCGLSQQLTCYHELNRVETLLYYDDMYKIALAAHCRLFNHNELKQQLEISSAFNISDTHLILKAYLKWGLDYPNYLVGEFSILLWDEKTQMLSAVVDQFNSRPLYYYIDSNQAIFASEINALFSLDIVPRKLNLSKIARNDWLNFQAEPGETAFSSIFALPAAHRLIITESKYELYQYWKPELQDAFTFRTDAEFSEAFQAQFAAAVKSTTNSNLPVCLQLSGGLDSSAIAMMYVKQNPDNPLICLSNVLPIANNQTGGDEREFLTLLQSDKLKQEFVIDEWRGPFDSFDKFSTQLNISAQYYQHHAINDAARKYNAKIILHGTLGEITSSYQGHEYLAELFLQCRWLSLFKEITKYKTLVNQPAHRIFLNHVLKAVSPKWLKKSLANSSRSKLLTNSLIRLDFIAEVISNSQLNLMTEQFLRMGERISLDARQNALTQLNWFLEHASLLFNPFPDDTKQAVYLSNPYFDKRFVEFCLRVPNKYRFQNGYPRSMIRIGMQNILPTKITTRMSKTPFLPDYFERYYRQLPIAREELEDLSSHPLVKRVIDVTKLKQLIDSSSASQKQDENQQFLDFLVIPRTIYLAKFLSSF